MDLKLKREDIFFFLMDIYIGTYVLSESQLIYISQIDTLLRILRYVLLLAVCFYVVYLRVKNTATRLVVSFVMAMLLVINAFLMDGGISPLFLFLFVVASKGKPLLKTVKHVIFVNLFAHLFVVVLALVGVLENSIDVRWIGNIAGSYFAGQYLRHNLGFLHSNQVPLCFMMMVLLYYGFRDKYISVFNSVCVLLLNYFLFSYCGARVTFILVIGYIILYWITRLISQLSKLAKAAFWNIIGYCIFPACLAVSFIFAYGYGGHSAFFKTFDLMFNNRLRLSYECLQIYPLNLLGHGQEAGTYSGLGNLTVDNGYVSLYVSSGILIATAVIALYVALVNIGIKKKRTYLVITLSFLAVANIVNSHLISYMLLPIFCVLFNRQDPLLDGKMLGSLFYKKRKIRFKLSGCNSSVRRGTQGKNV